MPTLITPAVEATTESWLNRAFNPSDMTAVVKLACFIPVVLAGIGLMNPEFLHAKAFTPNMIEIFNADGVLVGLGSGAWATVDKFKNGNDPTATPGGCE